MKDSSAKCRRRLVSVILFMALTALASATNRYVRSNATGTGEGGDWVDAMTQLPDTLIRGDTYYIADGVYPGYTFDDPVSGTDVITIKKATEADHGTFSGWNSSYGDGVAWWTANVVTYGSVLYFTTDNWVFDGQVGSGKSNYGFLVKPTNSDTGAYVFKIDQGADNITVRYTEIAHWSEGNLGSNDNLVPRTRGFYMISPNDGGSNNILVQNCYMHHFTTVMMQISFASNLTVENCYFYNRLGGYYAIDSPIHGEAIRCASAPTPGQNIFRNNIFEQINGTGIIACEDSVEANYAFYGNVMFNTDDNYIVSNGIITNSGGDTHTSMTVANNTFYNIKGYNTGTYWYNGANNNTFNNLWVNCDKVNHIGTIPSYNTYVNTNVISGTETGGNYLTTFTAFVDEVNYDLRLTSGTADGRTDGAGFIPYDTSPYLTTDMDGLTRAVDGHWDRGAFEEDYPYPTATPETPVATPVTPTPTITPTPDPDLVPTNLTVGTVTASSIALSWDAVAGQAGYMLFIRHSGNTQVRALSSTSTNVISLRSGQQYEFRICSYDSNGTRSPLSDIVYQSTN